MSLLSQVLGFTRDKVLREALLITVGVCPASRSENERILCLASLPT